MVWGQLLAGKDLATWQTAQITGHSKHKNDAQEPLNMG